MLVGKSVNRKSFIFLLFIFITYKTRRDKFTLNAREIVTVVCDVPLGRWIFVRPSKNIVCFLVIAFSCVFACVCVCLRACVLFCQPDSIHGDGFVISSTGDEGR